MILGYYVGKRPEFKIQVSCVPLLFFIAAFEAEGLPFFFFPQPLAASCQPVELVSSVLKAANPVFGIWEIALG